MAPEVWLGDFGPKCDVWSLGVVLFQLLTGKLPFFSRDAKNAKAWLSLHKAGPDWSQLGHASAEARQFLQRVLVVNEHVRPAAQECLRHRWFAQPAASAPELDEDAVQSLCEVHMQCEVERSLRQRLVASLNAGDMSQATRVFEAMDTNQDGKLSSDELLAGLKTAGVDESAALLAVQSLMPEDGSPIEYSMFLAAFSDAHDDVLEDFLWAEFQKLDADGNGCVPKDELKKVIGTSGCSGRSIDSVLSNMDAEGDGLICFQDVLNYFRLESEEPDVRERCQSRGSEPSAQDVSLEDLLDELEKPLLSSVAGSAMQAPEAGDTIVGSMQLVNAAEELFCSASPEDNNTTIVGSAFLVKAAEKLVYPENGHVVAGDARSKHLAVEVEAGVSLEVDHKNVVGSTTLLDDLACTGSGDTITNWEKEFLCSPKCATQEALEIFKRFDSGGRGSITVEDMRGVLLFLGVDDAKLDIVFQEADLNGDGVLDYEEFLMWLDRGA